MPLNRYQIRNEYGLSDPELYRGADKDDPEALLEGVAMAGLVGVLRQLGDLAEFAAEIFHDLHEEVMATAARGHGLVVRIQQLEAEFPSLEKAFLSQTSHSLFLYNTGIDWHPNLRMDQNLITQEDLPRFVMDSYEECRGPPRLFLLDKFDVAGAGACLKRYTDPAFFKMDSSSFGMTNADNQREKKARKAKKKGSRWRNGDTPELLPVSTVKLHQLFLEESVENHINDPARRVKLKRRLNGFPFDSKTGKSYMEKFLKTAISDCNVVREISVNSSPLKFPSNATDESGVEILKICAVSQDKESQQEMRSPRSAPDVEESGQKQSINELGEELASRIPEGPNLNSISEAGSVLSLLHEDVVQKEITVEGERKKEGSVDGYQSDDIASEIDNYMDALNTMDLEMETDTECKAKNDLHFLNSENQGIDSYANEEKQDLHSHFSDSQSIGNSTATDDGKSSSRERIASLSNSDSLSNYTENTSDGDASAKILPSTVICEAKVVSSDCPHVNGESSSTQASEHGACDVVCTKEADPDFTQSYRCEIGEPSSSAYLADSIPMVLPVDPGNSSMEGASVGPELHEVSSNGHGLNTGCIDQEEYTSSPGGHLPWISKYCDDPSSSSCLAESTPMLLPGDPVNSLVEGSVGQELHEVSSNHNGMNTVCINEEENTSSLGRNLPWISQHSDGPSQIIHNFLPKLSSESHSADELDEDPHILSPFSPLLLEVMKPDAGKKHSEGLLDDLLQGEHAKDESSQILAGHQIDSPHSVASHAEEIDRESALPELGNCNPDMMPDFIVFELDDAPTLSEEIAIMSIPVAGSLQTTNLTKQQFPELLGNTAPLAVDSAEAGFSYSGEKNLDGASNSVNVEELGGFSLDMDMIGKDPADLELLSDFHNSPDSPPVLKVHLDDMVPDTVHPEVLTVATVVDSHCVDGGDDSRYFSCSPTQLQEQSISILESLQWNGMEKNEACPPEQLQESGTEKELDQQVVESSFSDFVLGNAVSCDDSNSELLNSVPDSSVAARSRRGLHIVDATTVLLSDHYDRDQESNSGHLISGTETAEDDVSSPTNPIAELRTLEQKFELQDDHFLVESCCDQDSVSCDNSHLELLDHVPDSSMAAISGTHYSPGSNLQIVGATSALLSEQRDQDLESKFAQFSSGIENAEDDVSSPTNPIADLRTLERTVELRDEQFLVESWHGQDSESKSSQQINVTDNADNVVSSPTNRIAELRTPLEQIVELQDELFDVESRKADKSSFEPYPLVEGIHSTTLLEQERHADAPSVIGTEFLLPLEISEQAKDQPSSVLPPYGLFPEASQMNMDEMPPLPPLPPMQWRIGKVQHASLAAENDLVGHNTDSFAPRLPSAADDKAQLGHLAVEGEISQPSYPFLPISGLDDESSRHGFENSAGSMMQSCPLSLQEPTMVHQRISEGDSPTSQAPNSFLVLPRVYSEGSEHCFLSSEEGPAQPSVNPFEPVTNFEDADCTHPSKILPKKPIQPLHSLPQETSSNNEKLHGNSVISEKKVTDTPDTTFSSLMFQHDQPQYVFSATEAQTAWSSRTSVLLPPYEDGKSNGNRQIKLPRPRNPLIDAVVAHDKSKLRKVTERVWPQIGEKIDERDSLLEQIRTKSFNLKPAATIRPSIQGPKTNLKVAAILEKANAIRQATAGSDEDDDMGSWSDS